MAPEGLTGLVLVLALVFAINLIPAFMPPTWSLLAFAHLFWGLPAWPLAIGGAFSASAGRWSLALLARAFSRWTNAHQRAELRTLGSWLDAKAQWAAPLAVLVYSFGPIPSNQLFIAAGLTGMRLGPIVGAFLAGRMVSYPIWIATAGAASRRLVDVFSTQITSLGAVALDLALIGLLVLFIRIDWLGVIRRVDPSWPEGLPETR